MDEIRPHQPRASSKSFKLYTIAAKAINKSRAVMRKVLGQEPQYRYRRTTSTTAGIETPKDALLLDLFAEFEGRNKFAEFAKNQLGEQVLIVGEEFSLPDASLENESRICVLADIVDGTDLLEMEIPLWCSAVVFFNPKGPEIIGSVVALANGDTYFALGDTPGAFVAHLRNPLDYRPVAGPSSLNSLDNARICFYGQKARNFLSVAHNSHFVSKLGSMSDKSPFRIYNFAGNPLMVKLVDRLRDQWGNVVDHSFDAVFDIQGQQLHDLVPGAYIALKGGACLHDVDGAEINELDLAKKLLRPTERMKYILASSNALAQEMCSMLN